MESNNINRISATGLKSIEIDELNTPQIIINNEGTHIWAERLSKVMKYLHREFYRLKTFFPLK